MDRRSNWEVIYRISDDPGDFFRDGPSKVERFIDSAHDLPPEFFKSEFQNLKDMENPQQRGRKFDYFMGLLFQQLPGVEVRTQQAGDVGEVDVHLIGVDAPDQVYRLLGRHTLIENKWEKDPIQKPEISKFHAKACDLSGCHTAYFASMSGFSTGQRKRIGALAYMKSCEDPPLRGFWEDDIDQMVDDGTPNNVLRDRLLK
ncbi:hypothetical protein [Halosimplex marinum]|uniref:hypothetical protein n=1 Tax=Halosimplex marinum TaxID=3396620 RepID=UPI003F56C85A